MRNKILGMYIGNENNISGAVAQAVCDKILAGYKGELKGGSNIKVANNTRYPLYEEDKQALYAIIVRCRDEKYLTSGNTALMITVSDTPNGRCKCCLIIKGSFGGYPSCTEFFKDYIGRKVDYPIAKEDLSGSSHMCVQYMKAGEEAEYRGDLETAFDHYTAAVKIDENSLPAGRKIWNLILHSRSDELKEALVFHVPRTLSASTTKKTGEDFAILAKSLYVYFENGKEAELDRELKDSGFTAKGYFAQAISDARYLGVDLPEFKAMEKVISENNSNKKQSSFFERKK